MMDKKQTLGTRIGILALICIFLTIASAESLEVTEEHPFLLNGEWMEARELQTGDLLTTVDGELVKITKITRVEASEPVLVYNLEAGVFHDFVVGLLKVVVHNSDAIGNPLDNVDRNGLGDAFKSVADGEIGPKAIAKWGKGDDAIPVFLEEETMLKWSSQYPKDLVEQAEGTVRRAFLVDGSVVDELPEELLKSIDEMNLPEGSPVVVKVLKYNEHMTYPIEYSSHFDLNHEALIMEQANARLGEEFFPKSKVVIYELGDEIDDGFRPRGIMVQETVGGTSMRDFNRQLNQFFTPTVDDAVKTKASWMFKKADTTIDTTIDELSVAFDDLGVAWKDATGNNLHVELKVRGESYTVNQIINSDIDVDEVDVIIRAIEGGGIEPLEAGQDVIIGYQRGGTPFGTYTRPKLKLPEAA